MGFEEAYNVFKTYQNELPSDDVDTVRRVIRVGIRLLFDARLMFIDAVEEHPKREVVVVGKKRFLMSDFINEMEDREIVVKDVLIRNIAEDRSYRAFKKERVVPV